MSHRKVLDLSASTQFSQVCVHCRWRAELKIEMSREHHSFVPELSSAWRFSGFDSAYTSGICYFHQARGVVYITLSCKEPRTVDRQYCIYGIYIVFTQNTQVKQMIQLSGKRSFGCKCKFEQNHLSVLWKKHMSSIQKFKILGNKMQVETTQTTTRSPHGCHGFLTLAKNTIRRQSGVCFGKDPSKDITYMKYSVKM